MEVGMLPSSTSFGSSFVIPNCKIRSKSVAFLASKNSGDFSRIPVLSNLSFRSSRNGCAFYCGRNSKNSCDSREGSGLSVASLLQAKESIKYLERNWCQMLKLNNWVVRDYYKLMAAVNSLEQSIRALTDEQLRVKTGKFCHRLSNGTTLDSIHAVVTVNDHLAQRDAQWMGHNHRFLGLSFGLFQSNMRPHGRKKAYACDITYSNNSFWKTESAVVETRNVVRGVSSWASSRRFRRIAATGERNEEGGEGDEEDEVKEHVTRATTLKQLDQQLATLAEREDSSASRPSLGPSVQQMRPVKRQPGEQDNNGDVQWPDFSAGFLGFFGFAMLLLTVVNNILFRIFLGPPVAPYQLDDPVQSSVREEPRYRIKSRSEEREEREAKATKESTENSRTPESKIAPALSTQE